MATNELVENSSFGLVYRPAELEMKNYDEMKDMVDGYAEKYRGLVFTRDEKGGATQARSELIMLRDAIDTERKNVKREYNKPLQAFENKIKTLTKMIDEPLNDIRDGLKVIDEAERAEREDALNRLLEEKLKGSNIAMDELERDERWLNKGNWTAKLKPTAKFEEEVNAAIDQVVKEKERKEAEKRVLIQFCEAQGIDPAGWLGQLEYRNAVEVIDLINLDRQRKEQLAKEQEQKAKEHEEFMKRQQEIIQEAQQEEVKEEVITNTIQVTGTVAQLNALNAYLVDSGIQVKLVEDEVFALDDLPF